ncbi:MAG: 2-phosphosulfolactate phosphatase, partial [Candidatus Limnocylindria bacterium]
TVAEAMRLRAVDPDAAVSTMPTPFLTGEVGGRPVDGFDVGNSPSAIRSLDLSGRRVIQRSSSGTQGVVAATQADEIVLGSFVTASATCRYLAARADLVTIVAMGDEGLRPAEEDEACAAYLEGLLLRRAVDRPPALLMRSGWEDRLWPDWFPRSDAELACEVDRFDFALPVVREDGLLIARPVRS